VTLVSPNRIVQLCAERRLASRISTAHENRKHVHRIDPCTYVVFRKPYLALTGGDSLLSVLFLKSRCIAKDEWLNPTRQKLVTRET